MSKEYTLIHPDISAGKGRAGKLIEELAQLYRNGECEDGSEIAAVVSLLTSEDILSNITYQSLQSGPIKLLCDQFTAFITKNVNPQDQFLVRFAKEQSVNQIPLFVGGLASATGALFAALSAADVQGGEVITTSLNYVGVPNSIVLAGATPRFVDIDAKSLCMDPESVDKAINDKTKAILLTHVNRFVDIEPFYDIIKRRGLDIPLIQDASLAIGSTLRGMHPGFINIGKGGSTVFSLAISKIISGLGGAIFCTNDGGFLNRVMNIAYQGASLINPEELDTHGANIKMNAMSAVIAKEMLKRHEQIFDRRRKLKMLYDELLSSGVKDGSIVLQQVDDETVMTHYPILVKDRASLAKKLYEKYNIMLGLWHVLHMQGIYAGSKAALPLTESIKERITFLPFHTKISDEDAKYICKAVLEETKE
ncbi:MAG: DegT/DnrJ/EryC1/StrS family aminotransferase [Pseudomonadota bacterium]